MLTGLLGAAVQDGIVSPGTDSGFVGSDSSRLTPAAAASPLHQRATERRGPHTFHSSTPGSYQQRLPLWPPGGGAGAQFGRAKEYSPLPPPASHLTGTALLCPCRSLPVARDPNPRLEDPPWPSAEPSRSNRLGGVEDGELLLRLGRDEAGSSGQRSRSFSRSRRQRLSVVTRTGGLHSDCSEFRQFTRSHVGLIQS